jgi:dTMP kinase
MSGLSQLLGKFIVFDGPDGAGKTTLRDRVACELRNEGLKVFRCKDPGGTEVGDRIRSVILDHDLTGMDARCEVFLFMASRAQLISEVVRPALQAGEVVLCDRFISASCAYQVAAGISIDVVIELARLAVGDSWPDLTFVVDVPVDVGFARLASSSSRAALDSMERRSRDFHNAVRRNFLDLSDRYPAPVEVVDGRRPLDELTNQVITRLEQFSKSSGP